MVRLFVFVLTVILALGGCSSVSTSTGVEYLIGVSQANTIEPWRVVLMRELMEEAEKHSNIRLVFTDATNSSLKQSDDIDKLVGYGIDLLIISPCDADGMETVIGEINKSIPVIVLDRFFEGADYTLFIGPDNERIGRQVGETIAGFASENTTAQFSVLELHGNQYSTAMGDRVKGLNAVLTDYPNIVTDSVTVGNGSSDSAEDAIKTIGDQIESYDLIFTYNDFMALGAYKAIKERAIKPKIISVDGFKGPDGGLDLIRRGAIEEIITCPTGGRDAIRFAMDILLGVSGVPKQVILRSRKITRENVESYERSLEKSTRVYENAVRVGYAQLGTESEWRLANNRSIIDAAKDFTVDLRVIDADQSLERQLAAVRSFIAEKMDVIVISPVVADGWDEVLLEAQAAGIPVLLSDRKISTEREDLYDTFIGADFIEEGRLAMRWVADNIPADQRRVRIMQIRGTLGATPTSERKEGFEREMDEYAGYDIIYSVDSDFSFEGGQQAIEDYLIDHEWDIDVIYSHNDDMALGAAKALESIGLQPGQDVKIVSVDGTEDALTAIADGRLNCSIECSTYLGPPIMKAAVDLMDGRELPLRIITDATVYTAENIHEYR